MIIVLLDTGKKCINIYDEDGLNIVPFSQIEDLYDFIAPDQNVYYVTNATLTKIDNIVTLVSGITGKDVNTQYIDVNTKYLHSTVKGPLNIPDPNAKAEESTVILSFTDKYDIKILDSSMERKIKEYPVIANCIRKGTIEVINEIQKNKILAQKRKDERVKYKNDKARDDRLDDIIIKDSHTGSAVDMADNMFMGGDSDVETMDMTEEIKNIK